MKSEPHLTDVVSQFENNRQHYVQFTDKLRRLVIELLQGDNIDCSSIESRCKSPDSLRDKLRRKRSSNPISLESITDLCGVRIVVYYLDDIDRVCNLLRREFCIDDDSSGSVRSGLKPHEFGYSSYHLVLSLRASRASLREWREYQRDKAEVQVRTVLQHAWASLSHAIDYKQEDQVPMGLRRHLFQLSALLELADDQFKALRDKRLKMISGTEQQLRSGKLDIELNADSLRQFLEVSTIMHQVCNKAAVLGLLDEAYQENDTTKQYTSYIYSGIIEFARAQGLTTVGDLARYTGRLELKVEPFLKALKEHCYVTYSDSEWTSTAMSLFELALLLGIDSDERHEYLEEWGYMTDTYEFCFKALRLADDVEAGETQPNVEE